MSCDKLSPNFIGWHCGDAVSRFPELLRDTVLSVIPSQFFLLPKFHPFNSVILEPTLAGERKHSKWAKGWLEFAGDDTAMSSFYQAQEGKKKNKTGVLRPAGCANLQSLGAVNATQSGLC